MRRLTAGIRLTVAVMIVGCSSGDRLADTGTGIGPEPCSGQCQSSASNLDDIRLTEADVRRIIAQSANEALAQRSPATIAVVDRVGNVLGVFRMSGADTRVTVTSGRVPAVTTGLEGIDIIPDSLAAISKAVTGAYLSSEGNAFSSRSANQIVQQNFNPGETNQPSGPLFGVQFSQLACSDLNLTQADGSAGPKRSPLGLSADPGGFPLYKNGTPVGGLGVIADDVYGLDLVITDFDRNPDELIAMAGSFGFAAPIDRRGDQITVEGKHFHFTDVLFGDTLTAGNSPPDFPTLRGELLSVAGYNDDIAGAIRAGTVFGQPASGYRPATDPEFAALDAFELVDAGGNPRFAPRAGMDGVAQPLTADEVKQLLISAIDVANRGRAQIRRPLGSPIRVTVSVVDSEGHILGVLRSRDGPVFGTDVSLQKARTAAFFSSATAAQQLGDAGSVTYLELTGTADGGVRLDPRNGPVAFADYAQAARDLLGPDALTGTHAFADRSGGNLSRPFFPDGIEGSPPGPFSKPFADWSPFSTGLQLDLVYERIVQHVAFVAGLGVPDVATDGCGGPPLEPLADALGFDTTVPASLNNGLQIFPGSVPIYRGGQLIGGIGVSGDGVDQDDMVSFLGVHEAGIALDGALGNAPPDIRADTLRPAGTRLRYVQCPQAPFLGSDEQNVCEGK